MAKKIKSGKGSSQKLERPGREAGMSRAPEFVRTDYRGADKLLGKSVLITGGDSGIGRAVCVAFAREGADIAIVYKEEDTDAVEAKEYIEQEGRRCVLIQGDIGDIKTSARAVQEVQKNFGRLDVLINNAAEQHPQKDPLDISQQQLLQTFSTNIFGMFYLVQAALPLMKKNPGSNIINTASVVAYRGNEQLLDYSATKGAVIAFTRTLSLMLAPDIRVNAVAPGPIWTPLIPSTFDEEKVKSFGKNTSMGRPCEPYECAGAYVYLASADATYVTGQTIHVNGGDIVNA